MTPIRPCLWFASEAEEAARFYASVFPRSRIADISHYGEAGPGPAGSVLMVVFELDGQPFLALNGGEQPWTFNESISFEITCASQEEVDHFWARLGDGGRHGRCGWLKDRYGVSWQIVPQRLNELLADPDAARAQRAMTAMLAMDKLDVAELERAAAGG